MIRAALPLVADRIRAEEALANVSRNPDGDEAFFELAKIAWGEERAGKAMYHRFLNRGQRT